MSLYRELLDTLPFDPTEREGLWGYRRSDEPRAARVSLALGAILAICLATGLGVIPPLDRGAALLFGLAAAVFTRGALLARQHLRNGGWHAWRTRQTNDRAIDLASGGVGIALALLLATGGGGIGPALGLGEALFVGVVAAIISRALFLLARWP
jgi:hypothetical protein